MTVQRYPDPRLVTDSQSGGGTVHQSYGQGPPGSMPIDGLPQGFEVEDLQNVMDPAQASPGTDRRLVDRLGQGHASKDLAADQTGGWDMPGGKTWGPA